MTTPGVTVAADMQAQALIAEIERQAAVQRQQLLDIAAREGDDIRQRARIKARRQMHRAIDELRGAERQRHQQVRAELETAARAQASMRQRELLAAAWPRLVEAIERRWHEPVARAQWIDEQIALARSRLPTRGWVLRHPASYDEGQIAALRERLRAQGVSDVTLQAEAGQRAGLVIEADGARLDSTPPALLADRARAEAALLAQFEALAPAQTAT
jgi:hypothetical protein